MKKVLTLILFLVLLRSFSEGGRTYAGTIASLPISTNTLQVSLAGFWASNANAIVAALGTNVSGSAPTNALTDASVFVRATNSAVRTNLNFSSQYGGLIWSGDGGQSIAADGNGGWSFNGQVGVGLWDKFANITANSFTGAMAATNLTGLIPYANFPSGAAGTVLSNTGSGLVWMQPSTNAATASYAAIAGTATNVPASALPSGLAYASQIPIGLGYLNLINPTTANTPALFWLNPLSLTNTVGATITNCNSFTNGNTGTAPVLAIDPTVGSYLSFNGSQTLLSTHNLNATNFLTIMYVAQSTAISNFGCIFSTFNSSGNIGYLFRDGASGSSVFCQDNYGWHVGANPNNLSVQIPGATNWCLVTLQIINSNVTIRVNGASQLSTSYMSAPIGSTLPLQLGEVGNVLGLIGGIAQLAVWTNALDTVTLQMQEVAMLNRCNLFPRDTLAFIGDSILADGLATQTNYIGSVLQQIGPYRFIAEPASYVGQNLSSYQYTNFLGYPLFGCHQIDIIEGAVNDLQGGASWITVVNTLYTVCSYYHSFGHRIVYVTPGPTSAPINTTVAAYNSNRLAFIAYVQTNYHNLGVDELADSGSDPFYSTESISSNSTYYFVGSAHPTAVTIAALTPYIVNALQSLIGSQNTTNQNGSILTNLQVNAMFTGYTNNNFFCRADGTTAPVVTNFIASSDNILVSAAATETGPTYGVTLTAIAANPNTVLAGPPTGVSTAYPSYQTAPTFSAANLTGSIANATLAGAASSVTGAAALPSGQLTGSIPLARFPNPTTSLYGVIPSFTLHTNFSGSGLTLTITDSRVTTNSTITYSRREYLGGAYVNENFTNRAAGTFTLVSSLPSDAAGIDIHIDNQ